MSPFTLVFLFIFLGALATLAWETVSGNIVDRRGRPWISRQESPLMFWAMIIFQAVGIFWIATIFLAPQTAFNFFPRAVPRPISTCEISTDPTYGYFVSNPIQVGGGATEGPAKTEAYLKTMRGPLGEQLSFAILPAFSPSTAAITIYQISYPGQAQPIQLLIDYAHSAPLKAPQGFTCAATFQQP